MSIIDTLITDRTQADVTKLKYLLSKPKVMWSNEEWSEFVLAKNKGAYNATDLNRVQEAMEYLAERLRGYGYNVPEIKRPSITEVVPGTSRLPEGYTELEHIRSTGEQHLNSGFTPNQDTRVVVDFLMPGGVNNVLFGSRKSSTENGITFYKRSTGYWASQYNDATVDTSAKYDVNRHVVDKNKNVTYLDGVSIYSHSVGTFTTPGPLYLFATSDEGTAAYFATALIYSCQIYDNGTLVRDYVPCRTPSGEVGLYDKVNGVFYGNAGTGSFLAGPVVDLPSGYTPLEYIESTGTQYIDTEVTPNQDTGVTVDFQLNTASSWQCIFGARTGANKNSYALWHSGSAFGFYYASVNKTFSNLNGTERHRVVATKNTAVADGVSSVSLAFSNFNADYSLHLFASNSDGVASSNASMKLYSCQIYDNGTLVRDYVPCRNPSGEVGLYDKVNAKFYGNAGTGSFLAGPAVSLPVGYTKLEYIQSSGTQYINTRFKPNQDTRVVFSGEFPITSGAHWLFGARIANGNSMFGLLLYNSKYEVDYGTKGYIFTTTSTATIVDVNGNEFTLNEDETLVATEETFAPGYPMFLFTINSGGSASGSTASAKLCSCKIYDNGTLVRDFVPAMNSSGEVGLYDLVTASFYGNAGSGSFVAGEEMESTGNTPTTTIVRDYWKIGDIPHKEQMELYLTNLGYVKNVLSLLKSTPESPSVMDYLSYVEANNIEQILVDIEFVITHTIQSMARLNAFVFVSGYRPFPSSASDYGRTWDDIDALELNWDDLDDGEAWYTMQYGVIK